MNYIKVTLEQYKLFLNRIPDNYIYVPNMLAERTDIRNKECFDEIIGTRFIGYYENSDSYQVREDFINLCE